MDMILMENESLTVLSKVVYRNNIVAYKVKDSYDNELYLTRDILVIYAKEKEITNGKISVVNGEEQIIPIDIDYDTEVWDTKSKGSITIAEEDLDISVDGNELKIVTDYGYIIGYLYDESDCFWVEYIEVEKEYRNQGIASQIYKAIENYVTENYLISEFRLGVSGIVATLFWKEQGFIVEEYCNTDLDIPEMATMIKEL